MTQLKRFRYFQLIGILTLALMMACGNSDNGDSEEELQSLDEILQVAQQRGVNRQNIDWDALDVEMREVYSTDGFDAAVRVFLAALGDNQSFYGRLSGANVFGSSPNCNTEGFDLGGLTEDIGYIQMRAFIGSQAQATFFAGDRHLRARNQDNANLRGWVVDLTTTNGGDIYPQLAALGMFFDRETLGYFINVDEEIPFGYSNGQAYVRSASEPQATVTDPYTLMDPNGKLVVVIDLATAGAGEAALLALKKRPNTMIIGRPSCGLASVTQSFTLSNSDFLVLATHYIGDSERQTYPGRIQPDIQVGNSDDLIREIEAFLN